VCVCVCVCVLRSQACLPACVCFALSRRLSLNNRGPFFLCLSQAPHMAHFKRCWPDHATPLDLDEDELMDFKMMPRLPMCFWDFNEQKMVVASSPDANALLSDTNNNGRRRTQSAGATGARGTGGGDGGAMFFYAVDLRLSIEEVDARAERQKNRYIAQVR
jgi:hypothetical protein